MKTVFWRTPLTLLCSALISGNIYASSEEDELETSTAYYADSANDLVYVIDVDNMQLQHVIESNIGSTPYPVDRTNDQKTYVSTRGNFSISVIDNFDIESPMSQIPLTHKPRSTTYNARKGLALVSGANAALSSVIKVNNDKVKTVVGYGEEWDPVNNTDFGGSNATGHPFWHKNNRFFQLNRAARTLELYHKNSTLLDSIDLPTTAHHLLRAPSSVYGKKARNTYFMALEGNPFKRIAPGIMRFKVKANQIIPTGLTWLDCASCNPAVMGGHHADLSPDGKHIYMGSTDGRLFILDSENMDILSVISTGYGSGHTRFIPNRNLAAIINHNDTYVSLIDTETLSLVSNIEVSDSCNISGRKTQGHTTGASPDGKYIYGAASCTGKLFRIDLDTFAVDSLDITQQAEAMGAFLPTGRSYPIQGAAYFWQ